MNEEMTCIERFLAGENEGFEILVKKYQDRVLNIVYSLVGQDREAEDIMQEVFLKVYDGLKGFKHKSQFSTWLYRITVNTTYDFLRKRKNLVEEAFLDKITAFYGRPDDTLLLEEKEEMVQEALNKVPFKFRTALVLKDIEGLSYKQISEVLGCGIGTVESKIYRARMFLKKELLCLEGETK